MLVSVCRFSLPEQKIGALFNEKFKKALHTVENTSAHNLRLEIAAKLLEKFGSVERAFEHYTEGALLLLVLSARPIASLPVYRLSMYARTQIFYIFHFWLSYALERYEPDRGILTT